MMAAYAWNSAEKTLKTQGIQVAYAMPKEGILNWQCGLSITSVGSGDEELIYDFLDAWLDPMAGKFLIEEYGYGHSNSVLFEVSDPQLVADLGFPSNSVEMLNDGIVFQPYEPQVLENMVNMFDEVKIGL